MTKLSKTWSCTSFSVKSTARRAHATLTFAGALALPPAHGATPSSALSDAFVVIE